MRRLALCSALLPLLLIALSCALGPARVVALADAEADVGSEAGGDQEARRPAGNGPRGGTIQGVPWYADLARASERAIATGRPLLVLEMFGRLDERWC